jgi:hypothetical protein
MNKRTIEALRQLIELRKHGAETGSKSKAKKLNTELISSSRATTSQKSNKMPVDPYYWPEKTSNAPSRSKNTKDQRRVEYDVSNINDNSADEDYMLDNTSDATQFSDEIPILKIPRIENKRSTTSLTGIVPSMTMPEFTIDKNIKHFITDMNPYLSCFHTYISGNQKAYLMLSAVKGDAKDILLSYTVEQLNAVDKILRVLMNEFKKREQCVVNLHQIKQDLNENEIIFASRIRRYVHEIGVNEIKFDKVCIENLKIGSLSHIQHRLQQKEPKTFK